MLTECYLMTITYPDSTALEGMVLSGGDDTLRFVAPGFPSESHFICPKELASRLISMLLDDREKSGLPEDRLFVFSAEGRHVRIQSSRLHGSPIYPGLKAS